MYAISEIQLYPSKDKFLDLIQSVSFLNKSVPSRPAEWRNVTITLSWSESGIF